MNEVLGKLLSYGFITGSVAFGTNRPDSDIDFVYAIDDSHYINEIIKDFPRTPSDYFAGYFINVNGEQINLIPVHPHEFLPWYLATKAIAETLKISGIVDPIKKYAVFQGIVCLFKGTVKECGSLSEYEKVKRDLIGPKPKDPIPDFLILPDSADSK